MEGAEELLKHYPASLSASAKVSVRNIRSSAALDFASPAEASLFLQFRREAPVEFKLPCGTVTKLFVRPDRTIEQRDTDWFLRQVANGVRETISVKNLWLPNMRVGKNDFEVFIIHGREVHVLCKVHQPKYEPLQIRTGDESALKLMGVTQAEFQNTLDSANLTLTKRQSERI